MIADDPLARFSIKQRLKDSNNSLYQAGGTITQLPTQRQIHLPEHYNYFLGTMHKQIKHEAKTYKTIKQTIDEYKSNKNVKQKPKNAYHYTHTCFRPSKKKSVRARINQSGTPGTHSPNNIESRVHYTIDTQSSTFLRPRMGLASANSTTSFVRSPQSTVHGFKEWLDAKEREALLPDIQNIQPPSTPFKKRRKNQKDNPFEVMGGKPQWTSFESYRTCYGNSTKTKK